MVIFFLERERSSGQWPLAIGPMDRNDSTEARIHKEQGHGPLNVEKIRA